MLPSQIDSITPIVARYFRIDDTTLGDEKKGILVRYRGQLYNKDSAQVYDQLAQDLGSFNVTPLFRYEKDRQAIVMMNGTIQQVGS